eukprot:superscaffoldBa00003967_g18037
MKAVSMVDEAQTLVNRVRPALRHSARLHLRPRNVLSSSSSSQRPSHSSPTPSAGQRAPPHSPGQADLPGIWVD